MTHLLKHCALLMACTIYLASYAVASAEQIDYNKITQQGFGDVAKAMQAMPPEQIEKYKAMMEQFMPEYHAMSKEEKAALVEKGRALLNQADFSAHGVDKGSLLNRVDKALVKEGFHDGGSNSVQNSTPKNTSIRINPKALAPAQKPVVQEQRLHQSAFPTVTQEEKKTDLYENEVMGKLYSEQQLRAMQRVPAKTRTKHRAKQQLRKKTTNSSNSPQVIFIK